MTAQVAADLRAAAEVLRRDGWTQGSFSDSEGRCCARGAVHRALGYVAGWPTGRSGRALSAFSDYLESIGENPEASGARYNDAPGRTADEVIAALEAAADTAERKAAYDEGRWCGECQYGVVMDPPCCTTGQVVP